MKKPSFHQLNAISRRAFLAAAGAGAACVTAGMPLGSEIPADEDVAEAIVFFCSDRSRMITGETLQVHAGELLR